MSSTPARAARQSTQSGAVENLDSLADSRGTRGQPWSCRKAIVPKVENQPRGSKAADGMQFVGIEDHERARSELAALVGDVDEYSPAFHLHHDMLAELMIAERLSSSKIDDDMAALQIREQHA